LGLPEQQQNERSAYTLLALLNLNAECEWSDAANTKLGVRPIMDWMAEHYGKVYAENTRESVRRHTLHQFMAAGLVVMNPDRVVPVNSSKNIYQVPGDVLALLRTYGSPEWDIALDTWHSTYGSLTKRWAGERQTEMVSVTLPGGEEVELTAGGQNPLIGAIVEEFVPRFAPGAVLLYLGDAGDKFVVDQRDALGELGVTIDEHGKMPDVIVHDPHRNCVFLIEAVTSHGPINAHRKDDLKQLFRGCVAGLVFVTAFEDSAGWKRFSSEIAWETEVWLADSPSHIIHSDGDRYLHPQ